MNRPVLSEDSSELFDLCSPGGTLCPYGTRGLVGIGGQIGPECEDFRVDEIPAYAPSGTGDHTFVQIRKTGLSTTAVRTLFAKAAKVSPRDIGVAGRKDTVAVTTQWFSVPGDLPEFSHPKVEILDAQKHAKKLRMGHLKGNRFSVKIVDVHPDAQMRLKALLPRLNTGVPNYFGVQRFGWSGRSLVSAIRFIERPRRRVKDPRFLASVVQSFVFNVWLGQRIRDGHLRRALPGDVLVRRETGGLFCCEDAALDTRRIEEGELDLTGPLFGPKMMQGSGHGADGEEAVKALLAFKDDFWTTLGRFAPGGRRSSILRAEKLTVVGLPHRSYQLSFTLPPGAYATTLISELIHPMGVLRERAVLPST